MPIDDNRYIRDGFISFAELPMGAKFKFYGKSEQYKINTKVGEKMYQDQWGICCPFPAFKLPHAVKEIK